MRGLCAARKNLTSQHRHFVRIRTMLRADPKAVKRRRAQKPGLPNKNSIAFCPCSEIVQCIIARNTLGHERIMRLHVCTQTLSSHIDIADLLQRSRSDIDDEFDAASDSPDGQRQDP
jgi:hypothetical protein